MKSFQMIARSFIFFILLFSLFNFNSNLIQLENSKAIQGSSASFHFYIDTPKIIAFNDMIFSISNNEDTTKKAICKFINLQGLDISVKLQWDNVTLEPGQIIRNKYNITIGEIFSVTAAIKINCALEPINIEGPSTSSAINIINYVTYYSKSLGYLLDLKIIDQAKTPRNSSLRIYYKENDTSTYTPIVELIGVSSYSGYLPRGNYRVFATDKETNIAAESFFILDKNKEINLEMVLVAFSVFRSIFTLDDNDYLDRVGVQIQLTNKLEILTNVLIYAELYNYENKLISNTTTEKRSSIEKTNSFSLDIWFSPVEWETKEYTIKGYILSNGILLATKKLSFTPIEVKPKKDIIKDFLPLIKDLVLVGLITIYIIKKVKR